MSTNGNAKQKDWVLFPYKADDERATKLAFSGNVVLDNGNKGTILEYLLVIDIAGVS